MEFYELMVKGFDEAGWSQNYVSKEFNINRGILHRFYRGNGLISRENFREIIYTIPLSYSQKSLLIESFYKDSVGSDTFRRIIHIGNVLKQMSKNEGAAQSEYKSNPITVEDPENITFLYSAQIKMAVDYIFKNADPGKIYTNYPFSFSEIDEAAFNNYLQNRNWEIIHMINFKTDGDDGENIDNLFQAVKWVEYQCSPYYNVSGNKICENTPFPCFFAADSYCILFHPKKKKGIFIKSDDIFECIQDESANFLKTAMPLASYPKDLFELKNDCSRVSGELIEMSFSRNPCIASIINQESLDEVMRDDIPGMESIKKIGAKHYAQLAKNFEQRHVVSDAGLREFVETGKIIECPAVFLKNEHLPLKYRKQYLELMIDFVKDDRLLIIDSKVFKTPNISLELCDSNIQIYCVFQDIPENQQYCGNGIIILNDKRLKKDIELFIEYLQVTRGIYLKNVAEEYLRSILLLCDNDADKGDK